MTSEIRSADAAASAELVGEAWMKLRGARILFTGATGFLGGAQLETLLHANRMFALGARVVVLTRDPQAALRRQPWIVNEAVTLVGGDIATFEAPSGEFSHCIHGAAVASAPPSSRDEVQMTRTIVEGTRRCLAAASESGVKEFLFISSGAVYGPQPPDLAGLPELSPLARLDPRDHYARAKRAAEDLCLSASVPMNVRVARCFAFMGPGMPLEAHYAAGSFIRDAVAGGPIKVEGDGTAVRSYLYSSDAAAWLWTILLSGAKNGIYNVGSAEGVTISELAHRISLSAGNLPVAIKGCPTGAPPQRYVPSVARAGSELGLRASVPLPEAVGRTLAWARAEGSAVRAS